MIQQDPPLPTSWRENIKKSDIKSWAKILGKNIAQENRLSEAYRGYLQLNLTLEKLCLEVRLNEFKYAECGKDFVTFLALTRNQFCEIEPSLFAGSPDTGQRLTEQGAQLVLAQQPGKTQSPPWKATVPHSSATKSCSNILISHSNHIFGPHELGPLFWQDKKTKGQSSRKFWPKMHGMYCFRIS